MARDKPIMANRTRGYLSAFFNDAVERDLIVASPVEKMRAPAKAHSRDRVLTDTELAQLWHTDRLSVPARAALRVLMLTGQRRGETIAMEWPEVDLAAGEWRIPAAKTKNGRSHLVHLSPLAIAAIEECGRVEGCRYVFTLDGFRPISANALTTRFPLADATPHDLRRTFSTGCQRLGIEFEVREICVNHIAGGVAAIYARHDYLAERKAAMLAWGEHVAGLIAMEG